MKDMGTNTIETERLILRQFKDEDAEPMYRNWASNPEVTKYLTWTTHSRIEISKEVVSSWIEKYSDKKFYQWCIELKSIGEVIGSISVVDYKEYIYTVEIGYCIGKEFWNKGYTTEAFRALIDFFFNEVEVKRVEARHDPNNISSGKVMLKCGLRYEGTRIRADKNNTGICDVSLYGIVKD